MKDGFIVFLYRIINFNLRVISRILWLKKIHVEPKKIFIYRNANIGDVLQIDSNGEPCWAMIYPPIKLSDESKKKLKEKNVRKKYFGLGKKVFIYSDKKGPRSSTIQE